MIYGSVCSGIEAATVAWEPLGWEASFFSEIEKFPCAVLQHHYPDVPLHGDFTTIKDGDYDPINLLVGGTPCQSFSIAGLRKGMDDERGNLALEYLKLAQRLRPTWVVWENVPGILSSNEGRDFGAFIGGLEELGYGWAYRTLDAQHFGVPQRRRRIFVVGYLGDWRPPTAVLFERESLLRHPAPSREKRERIAGGFEVGPSGGNKCDVAPTLDSRCKDGPIRNQIGVAVTCFEPRSPDGVPRIHKEVSPTLNSMGGGQREPCVAVAFQQNTRDEVRLMGGDGQIAGALAAEAGMKQQNYIAHTFKIRSGCEGGGKGYLGQDDKAFTVATAQDQHLFNNMQVRRLTPTECERLQGFPDNYTRISWRGKDVEHCPDGPRYKACGNSMAVPVMRFIGERIEAVQEILDGK
jgi:DNA (cytosine-5)-methyltransferase 1